MDRRRYLIANAIQKKSGYVTDGLILHLDGIDYGGDPTKWIDLVSGDEFVVNGNVVRGENCFTFTNGSIDSSTKFNIQHIEIVFKWQYTVTWRMILNANISNRSIAIFALNTLQIPSTGGNSGKTTNIPWSTLMAISSDYTKIYRDGQQVTTSGASNNYTSTFNGLRIGQNVEEDHPFAGDICCVRAYNRALTAEEIAQNFAVDKVRFSIPD